MSPQISRRTSLSILLAVAGAQACGAKKAKEESSSKKKSTSSAAKTEAAAPPAGEPAKPATPAGAPGAGTGKDLKVSVWETSCKYNLGAVSFNADEQKVTIDCEIENLMSQNQSPSPTVYLEADGAVISHGGLEESKEIIAKQKVKNKIAFTGLQAFDAAKTTLVMGSGEMEQARIPLSGAGPNRTLEPVKQAFTGEIKIGISSFNVKNVEVRWDRVPYSYEEIPKEKAYLVFIGDLKNGFSDADINVNTTGFVLTQPDGTKTTGDASGPEGLVLKTKTLENFYVIFKIDAKGGKYQGDYTLDTTQNWTADGIAIMAAPTKLTLK